jgi:hypothetical protein
VPLVFFFQSGINVLLLAMPFWELRQGNLLSNIWIVPVAVPLITPNPPIPRGFGVILENFLS